MDRSADVQLVLRAQEGDKSAFAELFTHYEGRIFGYLYRMVGERTWAEDLAQEAFVRAYQHIGTLGPPYDFKSWLYRIASNLALDGLRRYREEAPLPDWDAGEAFAPEPTDGKAGPEQRASLSEVRSAVWRTLHGLSDTYRQILTLRELDGFSYREIAATLGISIDNVKVTLHRARLQFRDLYGYQVMVEQGRAECHVLDELLSAEMDGELDRSARRRVKAHVESCPVCQRTRKDLLAVASLLGVLAPVFPPPTLRTRFVTRLQHLPPPQPSPPAPPGGGRPPGHAAAGGGGVPWPIVIGGLGGLLILGFAAVLFLFLLPQIGAPPPTPTPVPAASPPPSATGVPPSPVPTATPSPTATPLPSPTPPPSATPVPPAPLPTSTPVPSPTAAPHVAFWADATTVRAGACTTIHWDTANVQAVFYDGMGVLGVQSTDTCPCATEAHTLDVLLRDGSHDVRTLTIQVTGSCVTPTPDTQGPPAPQTSQPTNGEVLSCRAEVVLAWTAASDPSGVSGYYVQLERDQVGYWNAEGTWGPLTGTETGVPVSCGLGYRWSVRAEDGAGNVGPWSDWAQFGIGVD
jgi:RNA polymerase sigma-70 factor (ECF subfamily)